MNELIGKTPFIRLLIPFIAGILACTFLPPMGAYGIWFAISGLAFMLVSFFIQKQYQFNFRWVFGAGVNLFLFSIALLTCEDFQNRTAFTFSRNDAFYTGVIMDIPELKPRSIACNVRTTYPQQKKVVLYFQQTDEAFGLQPGDEIVFSARMQPFKNFGNPDDFDYERFMQTKGFTGSAYIAGSNWQKTEKQTLTPYILAQRTRQKALKIYQSFQLNPDALAFVSALTLGYKADLTDSLRDAFRAAGTSHVLAVSGLHVAIIYIIINLLFSFLGNTGKPYVLRQWLVIVVLWAYVFITGLSVSVIRAAVMLTLFCFTNIRKRKGFTYNTLAVAAFAILLFRPLSLFEVGFQMSFAAVLAILFFQPKIKTWYTPQNKFTTYMWNLFAASLSAQLGVFPLVLHYFGTFPTYFFATNLLIVPLIGIVMYATLPLVFLNVLTPMNWAAIDLLATIFRFILKTLIEVTLRIVYVTETLPFAELSGKYISALQTVLIIAFIFFFTQFLQTKRARQLLIAAIATLCFLLVDTYEIARRSAPELVVFNTAGSSEIGWFYNAQRHATTFPENGFIAHPSKRVVRLSENVFDHVVTDQPFAVDVLILSQNQDFNLTALLQIFDPAVIVIDSSVPRFVAGRIANESRKMGIPLHDVTQMGAYFINF